MSEEHASVRDLWMEFLNVTELVVDEEAEYEAYSFCDDEESANELADLVKKGKKTATSSLHCLYALEGEDLPKVGEYSIILNWAGEAVCVIKNTRISIVPFKEVTEEHARSEGEGDGSLAHWRRVHNKFFSDALRTEGMEFSEDLKVVCEAFEVVFSK